MLEIKNISFSYGKKSILRDVSLTVNPGDSVGIVGRNGAGKSTLLSLIAGCLIPSAGSILIDQKISPAHYKDISSLIGYIPQEAPLIPELSTYDNLRFFYNGSHEMLEKELSSSWIGMLGIHEFLKQNVSKLSGGQKRRLSIACVICNHPPILIMDEPSNSIDMECRQTIHHFMSQFREENGTLLLTTHDDSELQYCNKLYTLRNGKLIQLDLSLRGQELLNQL